MSTAINALNPVTRFAIDLARDTRVGDERSATQNSTQVDLDAVKAQISQSVKGDRDSFGDVVLADITYENLGEILTELLGGRNTELVNQFLEAEFGDASAVASSSEKFDAAKLEFLANLALTDGDAIDFSTPFVEALEEGGDNLYRSIGSNLTQAGVVTDPLEDGHVDVRIDDKQIVLPDETLGTDTVVGLITLGDNEKSKTFTATEVSILESNIDTTTLETGTIVDVPGGLTAGDKLGVVVRGANGEMTILPVEVTAAETNAGNSPTHTLDTGYSIPGDSLTTSEVLTTIVPKGVFPEGTLIDSDNVEVGDASATITIPEGTELTAGTPLEIPVKLEGNIDAIIQIPITKEAEATQPTGDGNQASFKKDGIEFTNGVAKVTVPKDEHPFEAGEKVTVSGGTKDALSDAEYTVAQDGTLTVNVKEAQFQGDAAVNKKVKLSLEDKELTLDLTSKKVEAESTPEEESGKSTLGKWVAGLAIALGLIGGGTAAAKSESGGGKAVGGIIGLVVALLGGAYFADFWPFGKKDDEAAAAGATA